MAVTYDTAAEVLRARLGDHAFDHCDRTAQTAGALAMLYGVDPMAARLAGLLHDWHRELPSDELVAAAEEAGLDLIESELDVPYLLHARTGAAELREEMPDLPEEVICAVEHHTVGDPHMSDLDKVVYIADMIEPHRHWKGVNDLRESVGSLSLNDLFALAYEYSVVHLVKSRKAIHPKTVQVWNALVARRQS